MTLRLWLFLFIISIAISTEVLAWAIFHGQFHQVNRARSMPLRRPFDRAAAPRSRHPRATLIAILATLGLMVLVFANGIATLLHQALG